MMNSLEHNIKNYSILHDMVSCVTLVTSDGHIIILQCRCTEHELNKFEERVCLDKYSTVL